MLKYVHTYVPTILYPGLTENERDNAHTSVLEHRSLMCVHGNSTGHHTGFFLSIIRLRTRQEISEQFL